MGHVLVDESGKLFIIDFDHAKSHSCRGKDITFHTPMPELEDYGCMELYDACCKIGAWTPGQFLMILGNPFTHENVFM